MTSDLTQSHGDPKQKQSAVRALFSEINTPVFKYTYDCSCGVSAVSQAELSDSTRS